MKPIKIINLGGTISSVKDEETGKLKSGILTGKELLDYSGLNKLDIELEIDDYISIPSPEIRFKDLINLSENLNSMIISDEYKGIVLTHGTDTMEETAFFLDLVLEKDIPVVITGSQRSFQDLGFDGFPNIRDSILVANSEKSRNKGVMVVFNQKIYKAEHIIKSNSTNVDGFSSLNTGNIGDIYGEEVKYYFENIKKENLKINSKELKKQNVEIFSMALDYNTWLLDLAIDSNRLDGVVIEGFGVGAVVPEVQDSLELAIQKGIPVVLVTRCREGGVRDTYMSKGGGVQLKNIGVIFESNLTAAKARLKLILLLNNFGLDNLETNWKRY